MSAKHMCNSDKLFVILINDFMAINTINKLTCSTWRMFPDICGTNTHTPYKANSINNNANICIYVTSFRQCVCVFVYRHTYTLVLNERRLYYKRDSQLDKCTNWQHVRTFTRCIWNLDSILWTEIEFKLHF